MWEKIMKHRRCEATHCSLLARIQKFHQQLWGNHIINFPIWSGASCFGWLPRHFVRCLNKHTPAYMSLMAPEEGGGGGESLTSVVRDNWGRSLGLEKTTFLQMACSLEVKHRHEEELQLGRRGQTTKQKLPLEKMLKFKRRVQLFKMWETLWRHSSVIK